MVFINKKHNKRKNKMSEASKVDNSQCAVAIVIVGVIVVGLLMCYNSNNNNTAGSATNTAQMASAARATNEAFTQNYDVSAGCMDGSSHMPDAHGGHIVANMGHGGVVHASKYPNEEDPSSLNVGSNCASHYMGGNMSACDYELSLDNLVPGSWRNSGCDESAQNDPDSQWVKYAPKRKQFHRFNQVLATARLGKSTRSAHGRNVGIPLLLRSSTATPLTHTQFHFNDSHLRQDALHSATGSYPTNHMC